MIKKSGKEKVILFLIGWPLGQGGHIASLLTFIKLLKNNYSILLIAPYGDKQKEFENQGVKVINTRGEPNKLSGKVFLFFQILLTIFKYKVNIIHAFDYVSLIPAVISKLFTDSYLIYTKAGGPVPNYKLPPIDHLVVFSEELLEHFKKNEKNIGNNITLIKERIDTSFFNAGGINNIKKVQKKQKLNLFMAMRLETSKKKWLDNVFENLLYLNKDEVPFYFTLAGNGNLFDYYLKKIKKSFTKNVSLLGEVTDSDQIKQLYLQNDIIIGHGRGVLEAMSCNKCCIILGQNNEAELINIKNIHLIEKYNFSGRHFNFKKNKENLYEVLKKLYNKSISECNNRKYILENYDSKIGAKKLNKIYNVQIQNIQTRKFKIVKWISYVIFKRLTFILKNV